MISKKQLFCLLFGLLVMHQVSFARTVEEIKNTIANYVSLNHDARDYDAIASLAREVLSVSRLYSDETLAQIQLLLADKANHISDSTEALKRANAGLQYANISSDTRLRLLLRALYSNFDRGMYLQVLSTSDYVLNLEKSNTDSQFAIHALAFRSIAHSSLGNYQEGLADLRKVTELIEPKRNIVEYIDVMETIVVAHSYLGKFKVALEHQEKLVKLRNTYRVTANLDKSLYHLANIYQRLSRYDDAYTLYLESKRLAQLKNADISVAYAHIGLGSILLAQGDNQQAFDSLSVAETVFQRENLINPYLTTLILLAKTSLALDAKDRAFRFLEKAATFTASISLTHDQLELYVLLALMYQEQQKHEQALVMYQTYIDEKEKYYHYKLSLLLLEESALEMLEHSHQLTANFVERSTQENDISTQLKPVKQANVVLAIIVAFTMIITLWIWLKYKKLLSFQGRRVGFDLLKLLPNSEYTRQSYKREFKAARHYQYPITLALIKITNWQEIAFKFDKRILKEVQRGVSQLLSDKIGPYDKIGQLGDNEYLLIFPHARSKDVTPLLEKMNDELALRFFANIGQQSVTVQYVCESPTVQDIDPYIFLAKMSSSLAEGKLLI